MERFKPKEVPGPIFDGDTMRIILCTELLPSLHQAINIWWLQGVGEPDWSRFQSHLEIIQTETSRGQKSALGKDPVCLSMSALAIGAILQCTASMNQERRLQGFSIH